MEKNSTTPMARGGTKRGCVRRLVTVFVASGLFVLSAMVAAEPAQAADE